MWLPRQQIDGGTRVHPPACFHHSSSQSLDKKKREMQQWRRGGLKWQNGMSRGWHPQVSGAAFGMPLHALGGLVPFLSSFIVGATQWQSNNNKNMNTGCVCGFLMHLPSLFRVWGEKSTGAFQDSHRGLSLPVSDLTRTEPGTFCTQSRGSPTSHSFPPVMGSRFKPAM